MVTTAHRDQAEYPCLWDSLIQENNQVFPVGHFLDISPDALVYFLDSKTMRWPLQ